MPDQTAFMEKIESSDLSEESKRLMSFIVDYFEECSKEKDKKIAKLKGQVKDMNARLQTFEQKQDEANQYSRLDCITISPKKDSSGSFVPNTIPNYDNAENTKQLVIDLFKDQLNLNLQNNDISIAHRLKPPRRSTNTTQQQHDRRNIVVRLCRKELVGTIFRHCKEMTPNFYVNESLTPVRHSICYALRTLKRKHGEIISKVQTFKGVPRVSINLRRTSRAPQTEPATKRYDIPTILELENFARTVLKTTLPEQGISFKNRV